MTCLSLHLLKRGSKLPLITPGNMFSKYADDTHLLVPPTNSNSIQSELDHVAEWSENNNLKLNASKTVEMIIHKPRFNVANAPAPLPGISRQSRLKILGVTITDTSSFDVHVNNVVTRVAQAGYALRTLKAHGLAGRALWDVAGATTISRLTYASPAWYGFLTKNLVNKAQGVINRLKCGGFLPPTKKISLKFVRTPIIGYSIMFSAIIIMFSINYCLLSNPLLTTCAREFIIAHYPPLIIVSGRTLYIDNRIKTPIKYFYFLYVAYLVSAAIFCCLPIFYVFFFSLVFMCVCHVSIKCLLTYFLTYLKQMTPGEQKWPSTTWLSHYSRSPKQSWPNQGWCPGCDSP